MPACLFGLRISQVIKEIHIKTRNYASKHSSRAVVANVVCWNYGFRKQTCTDNDGTCIYSWLTMLSGNEPRLIVKMQ